MIHFLDVQVIYEPPTIFTTVYRKPSNIEVIIPRWSNDRWKYKKVAIRSYFKRALTHCSTESFLNIEVRKIKEIAWRHGYSRNIVDKTLKEIKLKNESADNIR